MTRETRDAIHVLVRRADGRVEVEETTPRYVCEPYEPVEVEPEPEPDDDPKPERGRVVPT